MRTKAVAVLVSVFMLACGATLCGEPAAPLASLEPALQEALERDAVCSEKSPSPGVPVATQAIVAGGREAGVIASPQDPCHCKRENCSTFVYVKSGERFQLELADMFASIRPMKIAKHGLPSLSAKFQLDELREETTIFDWNGQGYEPSLCATVSKRPNQRVPSIVKHQCRTSARTIPR
jgi:hypothetical protein